MTRIVREGEQVSFDRSNPAHLAALKAEIATDPAGMGYVPSGGTVELLAKLNNPALNVGGDTLLRPTEELDIPDIAAVINPSEYAALSAYDQQWVIMFINRPADEMLRPYQAKFLSLFGAGSVTRAAALALRTKDASRAEVLFGVNTVIAREDWFAARDS